MNQERKRNNIYWVSSFLGGVIVRAGLGYATASFSIRNDSITVHQS